MLPPNSWRAPRIRFRQCPSTPRATKRPQPEFAHQGNWVALNFTRICVDFEPLLPGDNAFRAGVGRLLRRQPQTIELAIEGRAADLQPSRHFGHLAAVV